MRKRADGVNCKSLCIIFSLSLSAMRLSNHASKSLDCGCRYGNLSSGCNVDKGLIVFKKKFYYLV